MRDNMLSISLIGKVLMREEANIAYFRELNSMQTLWLQPLELR